eukprot:Gb_37336 [translate_table: standard]
MATTMVLSELTDALSNKSTCDPIQLPIDEELEDEKTDIDDTFQTKPQSEQRPPLVKSNSINDLSNLSNLKNLGRKEPKQGGCLDVVNREIDITGLNVRGDLGSLDPSMISKKAQKKFDKDKQRNDNTSIPKVCDVEQRNDKNQAHQSHQAHSAPLMRNHIPSLRSVEKKQDNERDKTREIWKEPFKKDVCKEHIFDGPLLLPNCASANSLSAPIRSSGGFKDRQEDRTKASLVQKKGHFSVTTEDVALMEDIPLSSVSRSSSQSLALHKSTSVGDWLSKQKQVAIAQLPKDPISTTIPVAVLAPYLQTFFNKPSAKKLLKHLFFEQAKSPEYVVRNLLHGLLPLRECVKALQLKDAAQLALKKMTSTEQEAISQNEYKQRVDDELSKGNEKDVHSESDHNEPHEKDYLNWDSQKNCARLDSGSNLNGLGETNALLEAEQLQECSFKPTICKKLDPESVYSAPMFERIMEIQQ